jgi:hypothetical protein
MGGAELNNSHRPNLIELAKNQWLSQQQAIKKHQEFDLYR